MKPLGILIFASLILGTLQQQTPEVNTLEAITACVLCMVSFLAILEFLAIPKNIPKPLGYLLGFVVWAVLNVGVALGNGVDFLWWLRRFFPIFTLFSTALASATVFRSRRDVNMAFATLLLISLVVVLHAMMQFRSLDLAETTNLQALRKYGGGYYSAFGLCLMAPFLLYLKQFRRAPRLWILCMSAVFFAGLLLSFTRTYWISVAVALLFMLYLSARARGTSLLFFLFRNVIPIVLVLAILLWIIPEKIRYFAFSRLLSIPKAMGDLSFVDRVMELEGLWNSAIQNPACILVGNGLGAKFRFYSPNPWSWGGVGWIENDYSHNYYAYLFWSTGVIGLFLFLLFWGVFVRQVAKVLRRFSGLPTLPACQLLGISAATVNLLVASLTAPPLMEFKWAVYFGFLIGLALNLTKLREGAHSARDLKC